MWESYLLELLLEWAIDTTIKVKVKRIVNDFNEFCTQIGIDKDGNGVLDENEVLTTIKTFIPDLSNGYTLCNNGSEVGVGVPILKIVDSDDIVDWFSTHDEFAGTDSAVVIDIDRDGERDDICFPFNSDLTGDHVDDWVCIVDENNDGLPDAAPDAPFYPVGSPEYKEIVTEGRESGSIIIMSGDGTMSVYDMNGDITAEDCDTAYSLWVSENGVMDKPLDNYSVSEGMLFLILLIMSVYFVLHLFKRKDYYL